MAWTLERRAAAAARMKALHADPEFKARMKAIHADPEFKAAAAARMKALHADPEFKARMKASRGCVEVPESLKSYAAKLRSCGIRGDDFRKAIEAEIEKQDGR